MRLIRRRKRTQGRYVVLAGPDGCGKSTLVQRLQQGDGPAFDHRHWRPGAIPSLRRLQGLPEAGVVTDPHGRRPDRPMKAVVRTLYYWTDFVVGYFTVVRPTLRTGRHFVLERGWSDMCIDPLRYGLAGDRVVRILARFLPPSDLTIVLAVPAEVAYARKPELTTHEIARQLAAWSSKVPGTRRIVVLNADRPIDEVAMDVRYILGETTCVS